MLSPPVKTDEMLLAAGAEIPVRGSETQDGPGKRVLEYWVRAEEYFEEYDNNINCDLCGERTSHHYFSCNICAGGQFWLVSELSVQRKTLSQQRLLLEGIFGREYTGQVLFVCAKDWAEGDHSYVICMR